MLLKKVHDHICIEAESKFAERLASFHEAGEKAAVDEISFALDFLRGVNPNIFINAIIDLSVTSSVADTITHLHWALDSLDCSIVFTQKCLFPFLLDGHWCAIESDFDQQLSIDCVGVPDHLIHPFIDTFARKFEIPPKTVKRNFLPLVGLNGLCGWTILKRWFLKTSTDVNSQREVINLHSNPESTFRRFLEAS